MLTVHSGEIDVEFVEIQALKRKIDNLNKELAEVDKLKNGLLKLELEHAKQANTKKETNAPAGPTNSSTYDS